MSEKMGDPTRTSNAVHTDVHNAGGSGKVAAYCTYGTGTVYDTLLSSPNCWSGAHDSKTVKIS
jgi:hypothetical protein